MNLRVRKVTGCSRSAMFAYGRRSVRESACGVETDVGDVLSWRSLSFVKDFLQGVEFDVIENALISESHELFLESVARDAAALSRCLRFWDSILSSVILFSFSP